MFVSKTHSFFLSLCFLMICAASALSGCAANEDKKPQLIEKANTEVKPNVKLPTIQVQQTFNLSYSQLWTAAMSSLSRRNIGVRAFDQAGGKIETDWVNITDAMCGVSDPSRAQLNCRVRFRLQLQTINDDASGVLANYEELCAFTEEIRLECPDSAAEKLMLSIISDLRALDEGA